MLVVAFFWPRIREENEHVAKEDAGRERIEKQIGVGLQKMEVRGLGALLLSRSTLNAIAFDVEADAQGGWMGLGVSDEEMAVSAAELAYELSRLRKNLRERPLQGGLSLIHDRKEAVRASGVFHVGRERLS